MDKEQRGKKDDRLKVFGSPSENRTSREGIAAGSYGGSISQRRIGRVARVAVEEPPRRSPLQ